MPKVIEDAKAKILKTARAQLFEQGYTNFTLRAIAEQCGIAVGTIYNYFSSKDMLIASIMVEDWAVALARMRAGCTAARSVDTGMRAIYGAIVDYADIYDAIWSEYAATGNALSGFGERHVMLREQIADEIRELLAQLSLEGDLFLSSFLAECVLSCAIQRDFDYDVLHAALGRLFVEKKEIPEQ